MLASGSIPNRFLSCFWIDLCATTQADFSTLFFFPRVDNCPMAKVHIANVSVLDNPAPFNSPFKFEITFEAIENLSEDLEWNVIYVGSAETEVHDQVLDSVFVGPVPEGRHMFVFDAPAPDTGRIPERDALGVTVVLVTCKYRGQEFVRVGYYVNNDYTDAEMKETPPEHTQWHHVQRNILASSPRITAFKIDWGDALVVAEGGVGAEGASIDLSRHNQLPGEHCTSACVDDDNTMEMAARPPPPVSCGAAAMAAAGALGSGLQEGASTTATGSADEFMDFSL